MPAAFDLPDDIETLKRLVIEGQAALKEPEPRLLSRQLEIQTLKLQIAQLKRMQFGRSSEQLNEKIAQLEFVLEDLEAAEGAAPAAAPEPEKVREKSTRRPLPTHLPRESVVHEPLPSEADCTCPACGGTMRMLGEYLTELLEYIPNRLKVSRHIRPKLACSRCETIVQAQVPSRPIARGMAGPGMLAHVLVSKYADHLPLYRQSEIYAREGVELDRSTMAEWVGGSSRLLEPLVEALRRHVMNAEKVHADDTPVPVLAPGNGKTKTGRLW